MFIGANAKPALHYEKEVSIDTKFKINSGKNDSKKIEISDDDNDDEVKKTPVSKPAKRLHSTPKANNNNLITSINSLITKISTTKDVVDEIKVAIDYVNANLKLQLTEEERFPIMDIFQSTEKACYFNRLDDNDKLPWLRYTKNKK